MSWLIHLVVLCSLSNLWKTL